MNGTSFGKGVFTDGIKLRIDLEMSSTRIILDCYDKDPSETKTEDLRQDRGERHSKERPHEDGGRDGRVQLPQGMEAQRGGKNSARACRGSMGPPTLASHSELLKV